jgi:hypothetical protein
MTILVKPDHWGRAFKESLPGPQLFLQQGPIQEAEVPLTPASYSHRRIFWCWATSPGPRWTNWVNRPGRRHKH